ncbi:inositol monophosphatase [Bacillus lacus]|uniref:inositol-phosphate phosphatase n=1 Tax=Metabacillus lacus TaxID=1983721 RepID=A0A7X2LZG4_9BACI|nr:inositol monophosphatase family protein [Metabacillus lacus]MRX71674.1 inositol monophosphatase [Metabacillus lacus]
MVNWNEINETAIGWVREAGETIRASFSKTLSIETKSNPNDLVTNIDQETEQFFISKIQSAYPEHKILGEEGFGDKLSSLEGIVWIIDPIDGTMNFVHQQRNFAISIGIYENGVGKIGLIYDVVHDELYHAAEGQGAYMDGVKMPVLDEVKVEEAIIALNATWVIENRRIDHNKLIPLVKKVRGTRSYGTAALEFAYVASGRLDAYLTMRLAPWDVAAGLVLLKEVGGVATTVDGKEINLLEKSSYFVGEKNLHTAVVKDYLQS